MHRLHCRTIAQRPLVAEAGAKMHFVSESVSHPVWLPAALLHLLCIIEEHVSPVLQD